MPEDEGADGPGDITDAIGRQRRHDCDCWVPGWEEYLRKDQGSRCGVNEEVIVLQRRPDPAARRRLLRLVRPFWLMFGGLRHLVSSFFCLIALAGGRLRPASKKIRACLVVLILMDVHAAIKSVPARVVKPIYLLREGPAL